MPCGKPSATSHSPKKKTTFYDVGDIACENSDLETAQHALGQVVAHLLNQKIFPIVLGGGHETAWGHFQGIEAAFPESDCAIINFDAHFDLRPLSDDNKGSSGTPFSQIAASRQAQGLPFDYTCFGIQQTGNTASLFEKAAAVLAVCPCRSWGGDSSAMSRPTTFPEAARRRKRGIICHGVKPSG